MRLEILPDFNTLKIDFILFMFKERLIPCISMVYNLRPVSVYALFSAPNDLPAKAVTDGGKLFSMISDIAIAGIT